MFPRKFSPHSLVLVASVIAAVIILLYPPRAEVVASTHQETIAQLLSELLSLQQQLDALTLQSRIPDSTTNSDVPLVPFYSQFTDITKPGWQKVGCGIAAIAMLIDHHSDEVVHVDTLLERGIARQAFLPQAGWIHAGLINLAGDYGLTGESRSYADRSMADAFLQLTNELEHGPVMASVHYTFEPTNPIPHLVVVNAVKDGRVYYNDPAEAAGNGSITIEKFQTAWKKRFIAIYPA